MNWLNLKIKKILKIKNKIIFILLLLAVVFPLCAQPIQAFSTPLSTYPFQFWNAVFNTDEMNLQSFVFETYKAVIMSIITPIIGCWNCSGDNPWDKPYFGAIMIPGQFMAMLYSQPPASGVEYLAHIGRKLDLVPEVYAQGLGFEKMEVIMTIWQAFRNISYVFLVLIIVFMGFAIMFRLKISPQTVITIQSAIPKIVLSLLLITFSYAIVGFLIDLMYVVSNLIISVFNNADPQITFEYYLQMFGIPGVPITDDAALYATMLFIGAFPVLVGFLIMMIIVGLPSAVALATPLALLGIGGLIILGIVAVIYLIALLRVTWSLLKAYINVVLALVFGPFLILAGAIPGSKTVGSWFRNIIANLAVFPVTLTMVFLACYLVTKSIILLLTENVFAQLIQCLTATGCPLEEKIDLIITILTPLGIFTGLGTFLIFFFVGLGLILMTPKVTEMIKAFMAGQPFSYSSAIGAAFMPVQTASRYGRAPAIQMAGERISQAQAAAPGGSTRARRLDQLLGVMQGLGWRKR